MPNIKREETPEAPIASLVSEYLTDTSTANEPRHSDAFMQACTLIAQDNYVVDANDVHDARPSMSLPPPAKPYIVARQALQAASTKYYGSSPRKYKLVGCSNIADRVHDTTPLLLSHLPSLFRSAMATGRLNSSVMATTLSTIAEAPTLPHIEHLLRHNTRVTHNDEEHLDEGKMDQDSVITDDQIALPPMTLVELQQQALVNEFKIWKHEAVIQELTKFNQHLHETLVNVNKRLEKLEAERGVYHPSASSNELNRVQMYRGAADKRSRSPSLAGAPGQRSGKKSKVRKDLKIKIYNGPKGVGLPTPIITGPSISTFSPFARPPNTPLTPGRYGPPTGSRKTSTSINKRGVHNLDKMVPNTFAQLPLVPITDTELIVYFFNALSRPIVALRLYARGWGPAAISDVLNAHRSIEPPYLRNTCSVKCTTAIKKGKELYGESWEALHRTMFADASIGDTKATEMIRLGNDELDRAVEDYDIRSLSSGLKKHPELGQDGGIFTRCVQYCQANNAPYTLSNVWELAKALDVGHEPQHYPAPVPLLSNDFGRKFQGNHESGMYFETPTSSRRRRRAASLASEAQSDISDDCVIPGDSDPTSQGSI